MMYNFYIFLWILVLQFLPGITGNRDLATRVSELLPLDIEVCFLEEVNVTLSRTRFHCALLCKKNPLCLFACETETSQCRLYSANVSPHFPVTSDDPDPVLVGGKCYSLWADKKDLAPHATITAKGVSGTGAIDGFSCFKKNAKYMLHTSRVDFPWLLIDLGSSKMVTGIVVQTRGWNANSHFHSVEVRVGNYAGTGDFTKNRLLVYYEGKAYPGEVVTLMGEISLLGRYVSLQLMIEQEYLLIMEMKILTQ